VAKPDPQIFTLKFDSQQFHGVFDPAFLTTSSFDSKMMACTSLVRHQTRPPPAPPAISLRAGG